MAKKPFELWSRKNRSISMVGEYNTMRQLKKDWLKNFGSVSLTAYQNIGDDKIVINERMPKPERGLTEFRSAEERDNHIIANAVYFTIVRFLGVGRYERHEKATREEAESLAAKLSNENKGNYMIYAINERGNQAFVRNFIYGS